MKILKYNIDSGVHQTHTDPITGKVTFLPEKLLFPVTLGWSEANEEIAKQEAYNGEYTIEDDGQPDPSETPTQLDIIEAQVTYTAMITDTLLEGGLG